MTEQLLDRHDVRPALEQRAGEAVPKRVDRDIDALNAAGIAVVFAAGNTGPGGATSISPANNTGAIAVGSVNALNAIDPTSARGPSACDARIYPDVVAPGDAIKTTDLSFGGFPFYVSGTGTSYSTPHASGVLALLRSAFPNTTLAQLKTALTGSATSRMTCNWRRL